MSHVLLQDSVNYCKYVCVQGDHIVVKLFWSIAPSVWHFLLQNFGLKWPKNSNSIVHPQDQLIKDIVKTVKEREKGSEGLPLKINPLCSLSSTAAASEIFFKTRPCPTTRIPVRLGRRPFRAWHRGRKTQKVEEMGEWWCRSAGCR